MSGWSRAECYPKVAEGLSIEHTVTPQLGGKGFQDHPHRRAGTGGRRAISFSGWFRGGSFRRSGDRVGGCQRHRSRKHPSHGRRDRTAGTRCGGADGLRKYDHLRSRRYGARRVGRNDHRDAGGGGHGGEYADPYVELPAGAGAGGGDKCVRLRLAGRPGGGSR